MAVVSLQLKLNRAIITARQAMRLAIYKTN